MNNLPAATGIHDAAGQQYCSLLILIEVNEYCAMNYRAIGKTYCADLADQQAQEYRLALYVTPGLLAPPFGSSGQRLVRRVQNFQVGLPGGNASR
jgi:hypothetical protein